jgi:hypothetical protein
MTTKASSSPTIHSYETVLAGVRVTVSEPLVSSTSQGVTFLLPGAMIAVSEYNPWRDLLVHECHQTVLSFTCNVMWYSHTQLAQRVLPVYQAYCSSTPKSGIDTHNNITNVVNGSTTAPVSNKDIHNDLPRFNVVGHSVGGKIALLLASSPDTSVWIDRVIALDPVDDNPPVFTNAAANATLAHTHVSTLAITWNAGTWPSCLPPAHNAHALYQAIAPTVPLTTAQLLPLQTFADAGHMAYCQHGGGIWGWVMKGGTAAGNAQAVAGATLLVQQVFGTKTTVTDT